MYFIFNFFSIHFSSKLHTSQSLISDAYSLRNQFLRFDEMSCKSCRYSKGIAILLKGKESRPGSRGPLLTSLQNVMWKINVIRKVNLDSCGSLASFYSPVSVKVKLSGARNQRADNVHHPCICRLYTGCACIHTHTHTFKMMYLKKTLAVILNFWIL